MVEGMFKPKIRRKRVMRDSAHDAVFQRVAGLEAEDAHGFDAHILIRGGVHYRWIRVVGDGAGKNVRSAAVRMGDVNYRDFDRFVRAVEVKVELRELTDAE